MFIKHARKRFLLLPYSPHSTSSYFHFFRLMKQLGCHKFEHNGQTEQHIQHLLQKLPKCFSALEFTNHIGITTVENFRVQLCGEMQLLKIL